MLAHEEKEQYEHNVHVNTATCVRYPHAGLQCCDLAGSMRIRVQIAW
jgi:hypothetical protein